MLLPRQAYPCASRQSYTIRMQSARAVWVSPAAPLTRRAEPALRCAWGHQLPQLSQAGGVQRREGACSVQKVLLIQADDSGKVSVLRFRNALALEILLCH